MRMSSGPSCRNEKPRCGGVELHGRHAEIEHDAVDGVEAGRARDLLEIGEAVLDQRQAIIRCRKRAAERDRGGVAVDGDDLALRRFQDCAAVAAGAEGRVDIDAAVMDIEEVERGAAEHGNVGGWSASDSRAAAARRHSRAPSALRAADWELSSVLSSRTFWVASASSLLKPAGLPDLKLVTETNERNCVDDAGVPLEALAQRHAALAVDLQRLAGAVERQREPLALFRERGIARDQRLDLRHQRIPAGVDRRTIQRRIAIETVEAVAGEHRAHGCGYRDPPLGVEPQRDVRHEAVHTPHPTRRTPDLRNRGISWDIMGVNGMRPLRHTGAPAQSPLNAH